MYVYSCCKSVHCATGPDCTALAQFSAGYLKSKELHSNDDVPLKSEAGSGEVGLITTCSQCLWSYYYAYCAYYACAYSPIIMPILKRGPPGLSGQSCSNDVNVVDVEPNGQAQRRSLSV